MTIEKKDLCYWIGALTIVVIVLISYDFGQSDDLVQYVGFAATLASIVLAIVAIIYSIVSNSDLSASISRISVFSSDLKSISDGLKLATDKIDAKLDAVPRKIEDLSAALDSKLFKAAVNPTTDKKNEHSLISWDPQRAKYLLDSSSQLGLIFIYAAERSFKTKKRFDLNQFAPKTMDKYGKFFALGLYSALMSVNVLRPNFKDQQVGMDFLAPDFLEQVKPALLRSLEKVSNDETVRILSEIEVYFKD